MISFPFPQTSTFLAVLVMSLISACGGGGGGGSTDGGSGFTASNTNTKPQTSSEASSSSVKSVSSASTLSSAALSLASSASSRTGTVIDTVAPMSPNGLVSEMALSDRVMLSWNPSPDNVKTTSYKIYRDQAQIDTIFASDTTYYDFDVASGKTYTYSVSAGDATGNWSALSNLTVNTPSIIVTSSASSSLTSQSSSISSAQTSSIGSSTSSVRSSTSSVQISSTASSLAHSSAIADTTIPSQPAQVTKVNAFSTQVDISWTAATDNVGVTAYRVYRDGAPLGTLSSSIRNYSDKTVSPNMSYWYGVSAGDAAGNWSTQKLLNITTPTSLVSGNVNLTWLPPSQRENGVSLSSVEIGGYEIRYRSITENTYKYATIPSTQTQTSLINLVGDYVFEIAVFDTNGLYSNFVTINPQ